MKNSLLLILLFGILAPMNLLAQNTTGIASDSTLPTAKNTGKAQIYDSLPITIRMNERPSGAIDSAWVANCNLLKIYVRDGNGFDSSSVKVKSYTCVIQSKKVANVFKINSSELTNDVKKYIYQCDNNALVIFYDFVTYNELGENKKIETGPVFRFKRD